MSSVHPSITALETPPHGNAVLLSKTAPSLAVSQKWFCCVLGSKGPPRRDGVFSWVQEPELVISPS